MTDCTGPLYRIDHVRWLRANHARSAYTTCARWCEGDIVPDGPPHTTHGVRWYMATCVRCHAAYAWPNGRTRDWFEEHHRRLREPASPARHMKAVR